MDLQTEIRYTWFHKQIESIEAWHTAHQPRKLFGLQTEVVLGFITRASLARLVKAALQQVPLASNSIPSLVRGFWDEKFSTRKSRTT